MIKKMTTLLLMLMFTLAAMPLCASETYLDVNEGTEFKQSWRCPYCRQICEIGHTCKNPHCPSKYPEIA